MSDIPVEKKLELVHQVRSQYNRNQSDLMTREQILYGRNACRDNAGKEHPYYKEDITEDGILRDNTFCLRLALAGLLLVTFIVFDKTGKSIAGISTEQFAQTLASDYGEAVETWAETVNNP